MKMTSLQPISAAIAAGDRRGAIAAIDAALVGETGTSWQRELRKLADVCNDATPRFSVIAKGGNSKLPFMAFSSLPGIGFCPGAGDCLNWCYSFRAHRYPAAYARQAQNSILMQSEKGRESILAAIDSLRKGRDHVDFRLYVDGDFGSVADVQFWMDSLRDRPWLAAYGYSKSFAQLAAYNSVGDWPANYKLNLSSGHAHGDALLATIETLPITRGHFKAVAIGRKVRSTDHGDRQHQQELRDAYGAKAFTCPGKCGECTPKGHACGSDRFAGIDIIIAVH